MTDTTILQHRPRRFRAPVARGSKPAIDRAGGYRGAGIIRNASIVTAGEAKGHGFWLDSDFLDSVAEAVNRPNKGVKVRFTHPSLSGDGLGTFLGRAMSAERDGEQVIADIHFSEAGHKTPDGDLAEYVMDLAAEDPEAFGVSIVFDPDYGAEDRFSADHEDENGIFRSPDPANVDNLPHARLAVLRAADVVDSPAANPDGLFHRGADIAQEADALASYALGLTDTRPTTATLSVDPDRLHQFVARFLADHDLILTPATKDHAPMTDTTEPKAPAPTNDTNEDVALANDAQPTELETPTAPQPTPAPEPVADSTTTHTGAEYLSKWGPDGAVWFVQGKSWEEAHDLHAQKLAQENEKLTQRLSVPQTDQGEVEPIPSAAPRKKGFAARIRIAGR